MKLRLLIVDDSLFFRRALRKVFEADPRLEVIGEASNGRQAVLRACELKPDLITMDVEMPIMDGISAVRKVMERCPVPILMLSALTRAGAEATLDALDAGAVDFYPKNGSDPSETLARSGRLLCSKVRAIALRAQRQSVRRTPSGERELKTRPKSVISPRLPTIDQDGVVAAGTVSAEPKTRFISHKGLVAIGASTGGPAAVPVVLSKLKSGFAVPIVIAQHMPGAFTGPFASRLDSSMDIHVVEAVDGIALNPGTAYVIPGGVHGEIDGRPGAYTLRLVEPVANEHYRPSVNRLLSSVAKVAGDDAVGVVLTGMGDDGAEGAVALNRQGGQVWAQDQQTSVIYGMPAAVVRANAAHSILPLGRIGDALVRAIR
ncbi:MAG TPA: chemotaxis response regulator protein-glutamate methylesterase [Halothiobacillaceae bacterium]|nr:chemotaxis response regulator protein-glutamate methylesterase [Halothiobacillaceae bacterium]